MNEPYFLSIDLGAGQGTKIAVFKGIHNEILESTLPVESYGPDFKSYCDSIEQHISAILKNINLSTRDIDSIGIATAGILKNDGTSVHVHIGAMCESQNLT